VFGFMCVFVALYLMSSGGGVVLCFSNLRSATFTL
jgi:hypothetical protein